MELVYLTNEHENAIWFKTDREKKAMTFRNGYGNLQSTLFLGFEDFRDLHELLKKNKMEILEIIEQ